MEDASANIAGNDNDVNEMVAKDMEEVELQEEAKESSEVQAAIETQVEDKKPDEG